jgi:pyruvate kinase
MRRQRKAKIVATLGPSSSTQARIEALFRAGTDVFRLNFSHGAHEEHKERFAAIRAVEGKCGRPIGVLLDLQGPKLRVGAFKTGAIELAAGDKFRLDLAEAPGDERRAGLPHPEVFAALKAGTNLLLDDGKLRLIVRKCGKDFAECEVVVGGRSDRKGVNVPDVVRYASDRQGPRGCASASIWAPTGSRCRSCSARRMSPSCAS